MLLFALALFFTFFLTMGAVMFVVSISAAPMRKYALSLALGCLLLAPGILGCLMLAGLAAAAVYAAETHTFHPSTFDDPHHVLTRTFVLLSLCGILSLAALGAWLHQLLIHRMTFALFRLYATLVCAGIGSVFGWDLNLAMLSYGLFATSVAYWVLWMAAMLLLTGSFGYLTFRSADKLRGSAPRRYTWITQQEFERPALQ